MWISVRARSGSSACTAWVAAGGTSPRPSPHCKTRPCDRPIAPYQGLEEIHCPILSIGAAHDRIVSISDLEAFDRIAPNARTLLLEDSGHLMMLERPRAVNEQVDRFLQTH